LIKGGVQPFKAHSDVDFEFEKLRFFKLLPHDLGARLLAPNGQIRRETIIYCLLFVFVSVVSTQGRSKLCESLLQQTAKDSSMLAPEQALKGYTLPLNRSNILKVFGKCENLFSKRFSRKNT
jgi:hypothetical protein